MNHRKTLAYCIGFGAALWATPAMVHPHVFAEAKLKITVAEDGTVPRDIACDIDHYVRHSDDGCSGHLCRPGQWLCVIVLDESFVCGFNDRRVYLLLSVRIGNVTGSILPKEISRPVGTDDWRV